MLKLAGEFTKGQLADHIARLDAHTKDWAEILRTGEYYSAWHAVTATQALLANRLYATILVVARDITVDRIAIRITVAGAANTDARLGIFNNGTNLYPGSLLLDAGTVDVDSIGVKAITINQALAKGIYWLAVVSDGTPTLRAGHVFYGLGVMPLGVSNFENANTYWYVSHTFGALPNPFTAGGTLAAGSAPLVAVRVASLD